MDARVTERNQPAVAPLRSRGAAPIAGAPPGGAIFGMAILGNLLLVGAGIVLVALGRLQLSAMPGGDRGVGHAWVLLVGHGVLVLALLAITALIAVSGRLPPLPVQPGWRIPAALAFVGVSACVAAAVAMAAPSGAPAPWSLDAATRLAPLIVPALLLSCAGLLLNGGAPVGTTPAIVARTLAVVALLTVAMGALGAAPTAIARARAWTSFATRDPSSLDENEQQMLDYIESGDPAQQFVSLLGYTRAGNHPTIRQRALARMQSMPNWEQRVRDALASADAPEAFTFLSANDVPDPAAFAAAIAEGIRQQALQVRERIRRASHPSHLYDGLMIFEVEAVLQTLKKFDRHGVDYAPAMRELRAAFDEPTEYPRPAYRAVKAIDRWLGKRKG